MISNSGYIQEADLVGSTIAASTASIINSGTIGGLGFGSMLDVAIVNSGSIGDTGFGFGSAVNTGTLGNLAVGGGQDTNLGTITNSSLIIDSYLGEAILAYVGGTISNSGSIIETGPYEYGIEELSVSAGSLE